MVTNAKVDLPREGIADFCRRWKVREFSLFGSVLRDDFTLDSDIDVLVELTPGHGLDLFDWVTMIDELRAMFGRDIDLVSLRGLRNPFRREEILKTREVIHVAGQG